MADVLLFHHIQGLTEGVRGFAETLRQDGHTVHTPDLFEGRTFDSIEEGFGFAREVGLDAVRSRGLAVADELGAELVYAGVLLRRDDRATAGADSARRPRGTADVFLSPRLGVRSDVAHGGARADPRQRR